MNNANQTVENRTFVKRKMTLYLPIKSTIYNAAIIHYSFQKDAGDEENKTSQYNHDKCATTKRIYPMTFSFSFVNTNNFEAIRQ